MDGKWSCVVGVEVEMKFRISCDFREQWPSPKRAATSKRAKRPLFEELQSPYWPDFNF